MTTRRRRKRDVNILLDAMNVPYRRRDFVHLMTPGAIPYLRVRWTVTEVMRSADDPDEFDVDISDRTIHLPFDDKGRLNIDPLINTAAKRGSLLNEPYIRARIARLGRKFRASPGG